MSHDHMQHLKNSYKLSDACTVFWLELS